MGIVDLQQGMSNMRTKSRGRHSAVDVTVQEGLLDEAKRLNVSQAPEAGLLEALRRARADAWRRQNAAAIEEHRRRVEAGEFDEFLRRF
jgi:antitoxin CcdA